MNAFDVLMMITGTELLEKEDKLVQQNSGDVSSEHDTSTETDDVHLDIADFSMDESACGMLMYIFSYLIRELSCRRLPVKMKTFHYCAPLIAL